MRFPSWFPEALRRPRRAPLPPSSPVIQTEWGPVTESARLRAALNMKADPEVKARVVNLIGEKMARARYPEAGWPYE